MPSYKLVDDETAYELVHMATLGPTVCFLDKLDATPTLFGAELWALTDYGRCGARLNFECSPLGGCTCILLGRLTQSTRIMVDQDVARS